jgi:hypothetical protein
MITRSKPHFAGFILILLGGMLVVCAVVAQIAWLVFCFGSVVVGLLLLFLAPGLLIAPFVVIATMGGGLISRGQFLLETAT